jgi:hypothetical protein
MATLKSTGLARPVHRRNADCIMKKIAFLSFLATLATTATSVTASASSISFFDGSFTTATLSALYESDAANMTATASACTTCGNPNGPGLQIIANFGPNAAAGPNNGLPQATFAVTETTWTYNPAVQGAITSINASVDKTFSSTEVGDGIGNSFRPLIEQDNNFYLATIPGPTLNGPGTVAYSTISATDLTATDFLLFNFSTGTFGTANPNFSGDPIIFGLAQNSNLAAGTNNTAFYDNLSLTINSAVPEPSTWAMMILGFCGIGFMAYRRKNGAALA